MIRDKLHEIGILKALGAGSGTLNVIFGLQIGLIALITCGVSVLSYLVLLMALLKKHKYEQRKLQLAMGSDFKHPEMVFTSTTGNYKDRSSLNTSLKRFLKGTGFEYLTLHKLRHTNATLLLNNGIDLKIVSEHLGHADIQITAGTYTAVLDNSRIKTAKLMGQILTEQTPNKHQKFDIGQEKTPANQCLQGF